MPGGTYVLPYGCCLASPAQRMTLSFLHVCSHSGNGRVRMLDLVSGLVTVSYAQRTCLPAACSSLYEGSTGNSRPML